ncbi:MAG: tripartite tricarboxylate transporter substrate binding protein [Betaproteobacteria bacterium]|nr:tripartite tricarboxylate transporter substrate binding protein [Betaproteobacteria bacterium]
MKAFIVWGCCLLSLLGFGAAAQPYPAKPIEMVVPGNAGAGSDIFARFVADIIRTEQLIPQPLVINNRGGGGGAIAFSYVVKKRGDPYSILAVPTGMIMTAPLRSGLDIGLERFRLLALLGFDINCLMVNADSPYKTVQDLVAAAKAQPKSINVSIGSPGSTSHYFVYVLEKLTGARFNVVVMKSGTEAVTAVLGGHVHWSTGQISDALPHVEAGRMRILAVASQARLPGLAAVPTLKEQGFDMHIATGRSFAAPADIPDGAAQYLEALFEKVYKSAPWQQNMRRNMMEEVYMNGAQFTQYLAARRSEFTQFMSDMGLLKKK